MIGDLDEDNEITIVDTTIMKNYLLGKPSINSSKVLYNGDMDGDGKITSKDYSLLLKIVRNK